MAQKTERHRYLKDRMQFLEDHIPVFFTWLVVGAVFGGGIALFFGASIDRTIMGAMAGCGFGLIAGLLSNRDGNLVGKILFYLGGLTMFAAWAWFDLKSGRL